MAILIYLIKTILISGLLFSYYSLFLKNRPFHIFNRYFLLSIPVFSLLLPAFRFGLPSFLSQNTSGYPIILLGVGQGKLEEAVTVYANQHERTGLSWQLILLIISLFITIILFIRLTNAIRFINQLRRDKPSLKLPDAVVYLVTEKGTPFSFFRSIFWGKDLELYSDEGNHILRHELFHVKNKHTVDVVLLEILSAIFWFNPFFYLTNREIKAVHEYAADASVTSKMDIYSYANLLLLKVSGSPLPLTHPFFKNQLKRRIAMIIKSKNCKTTRTGRLMILPVIAVLICIFSFKTNTNLKIFSSKTVRVVIDAGHGGGFAGAVSNGVFEKNINLDIAKRIQALSPEYGVEVVMTRETDMTPGSKELKKSLEYIAALPKSKNADLFISIHSNISDDHQQGKTQSNKSGFQIYIPQNSSEVFQSSRRFGSVMSNAIKSGYTIESQLKQSAANGEHILILRKATVPSLLIECGYMDNPSDMKYLLDEKNQDFIARLILEGIRRFSMQQVTYQMPVANITDTIPTVDTLTKETLNKLDPSQISTMRIDKEAGLIFIDTKDGKTYIEKITPVMRRSWDSAHDAEIKKDPNSNSDKVFTKVELEAEYPGGYQAWYDYLQKNLKYPEAAVKKEIQGEVIVEFIVKRNGDLTDIHVISGPEELRETSLNILKESGKWIPAKQNGIIVDSYHRQPINYKLQ